MSKNNIENLAKTLPDILKNAVQYLKGSFDENGQTLLENTSGTTGVLLKLFAQPLIDKYFENQKEKKLENFGFNTYLKSSLSQARESVGEIIGKLDDTLTPNLVFQILDTSIQDEINDFKPEEAIMIYQPKYHPAVDFVKKNYQRILRDLKANPSEIKLFLKHFNENIEATVVREFGADYEEHLRRTEQFRLKDNETSFLWDTVQLGKIGFKETEDLKYEPTFAQWKQVGEMRKKDEEYDEEYDEKYIKEFSEKNELEERENELVKIDDLIEEYFGKCPGNHLEQILFVVADFGKGKSIFMKHYASVLAKNYLQTSEGYFPVYFNLRNFKNYSSETHLGIISDYLQIKYSIRIDDDYFQKKKYVFLVDSLDESGDLNKLSIDKVINSVKSIQGIDKSKFKTNRIIITSRPFDDGFNNHLNDHCPFIIKNKENRDIPYFISVYGFTKKQFNDWLFETLKTTPELNKIKASGFAEKIIGNILNDQKMDIYEELLKNKTLSQGELRRPIFAYMIYQLILNNVDFLAVGKIGVYLSFLNLLTKEAKHIHDVNYKVNLKEEFEFRNVLHATASLWMYERQRGKQGALKKADICRVLDGKASTESDNEILERSKGHGFTEIQFLSHSYFGENDNILHFQHQSFAEILLAEYYLKIFIKYALDEDSDPEEAKVKLVLGEPTNQTILFLKEMLNLIRETSTSIPSEDIIEKRKLLFPLMASLATAKHNHLFCNDISYSWYKQFDIKDNQTEYPKGALEKWCIDEVKLKKIISLAASILNSKNNYLLTKAKSETALFDNEVLVIQNQSISSLPPNIDQWLALLVGNQLLNNFENKENPKLFNWEYKINFTHLFNMIRNWNYFQNSAGPSWGKDLFYGIDMQTNDDELILSHFNFDGFNFSYSYLKNIRCWAANWSRSILDHCSFKNINLITSLFFNASIQDIKSVDGYFMMSNCDVNTLGFKLLDAFRTDNLLTKKRIVNEKGRCVSYIGSYDLQDNINTFHTTSGLMIYGLQKSLFTIKELKSWLQFENEQIKLEYLAKIDELQKYEVLKKVIKPRPKKT